MENQNTVGAAPETQQEKTFTQEQVNAIVSKRLYEDRASRASEFEKKERELDQREMQIRAKELLAEKGLPKNLADVLRYSDEESLKAAIDVLEHTRGFRDSGEEKPDEPGKMKYEGFRPIEKDRFYEHDEGDPFRKAMGLK